MEPSNPSVAVIVLATTVSFFAAPAASSYRHRSIDVDGVEAHYIEAGEGAPFILIHGGLAWSSGEANYAEVMAPLGEHFRVIAPDVIGFGRTTPRGARDYSGEAQGDFLIGFIEALDVGPVFLQGNSHGGFLAQYIAHKRPDLVRRLVITNSLNGTVPIPSLPEGKSFIYAPGGHQYASMTKDDVRTMLQSYYQHRALATERRVELVFDNYQRNWEYAHARGTAVSSSVDALRQNELTQERPARIAEVLGGLWPSRSTYLARMARIPDMTPSAFPNSRSQARSMERCALDPTRRLAEWDTLTDMKSTWWSRCSQNHVFSDMDSLPLPAMGPTARPRRGAAHVRNRRGSGGWLATPSAR